MYLHDQILAPRLKITWSIGGIYYGGAVYVDDGFGNYLKTKWCSSARFLSRNQGV
jgi:hypothetical protein